MALTPENNYVIDEVLSDDIVSQPSKTWAIDFANNRIGGFIDEEEAIRQFIQKSILTARSKYPIYTDDYGTELYDLIGADVTDAFLNAEIPRMASETIIYDDRVEDAQVTFERDGDKLFISVTATLATGGEITEEVEMNGL